MRKFLLILGVVILIQLVLIAWKNLAGNNNVQSKKQFSSTSNNSYPFDISPFENGYDVGQVKVYLVDLEDAFNQNEENQAREDINIWQKAAYQVLTDAALQSEGIEQGIIENTSDKSLDQNKINQIKDYFRGITKSFISGEGVSIWFKTESGLATEAARSTARAAIEEVYNKVKNENISIRAASLLISGKKELEKIDKDYKKNSLVTFSSVPFDGYITIDPDTDMEIRKYNRDEITSILTGKAEINGQKQEAFFAFYKITSKNDEYENKIIEIVNKYISKGQGVVLKAKE